MRSFALGVVLAALLAVPAGGATLTITPDRTTYEVGDPITLEVIGDAEEAATSDVFGRLIFDAGLAGFVASSQEPLTSFGGGLPWTTSSLDHGPGFADAFDQFLSVNDFAVDGPLHATVTLEGLAPGELFFGWDRTDRPLRFFGLDSAPGGSVTIVPEPSTMGLLALGLGTLGAARSRARRSARCRRRLPPLAGF